MFLNCYDRIKVLYYKEHYLVSYKTIPGIPSDYIEGNNYVKYFAFRMNSTDNSFFSVQAIHSSIIKTVDPVCPSKLIAIPMTTYIYNAGKDYIYTNNYVS